MTDFHKTIQHHVDAILFEEGSFSAISWLLRDGHLDIADYLNWKKDNSGYLEDYFKTALADIIAGLVLTQNYAGKQKLDAICQPFTSVDRQILSICRSRDNEIFLAGFFSLLITGCRWFYSSTAHPFLPLRTWLAPLSINGLRYSWFINTIKSLSSGTMP